MRIEIIIDVVSNESQYAMICERGGHILDIKTPANAGVLCFTVSSRAVTAGSKSEVKPRTELWGCARRYDVL
jgi:hypothetical protein